MVSEVSVTKIGRELGEELLTFGFLVFLVAAWIGVFLPATIRARQTSPYSTTERFRRRLDLLSLRSSNGRWVVVPQNVEHLRKLAFARAQRRRRRLLTILILSCVTSLVAAFIAGGALWEIHLALDASLGLYVMLLLETKRRRIERKEKVRRLSERLRSRPQPSWYEPAGAARNG